MDKRVEAVPSAARCVAYLSRVVACHLDPAHRTAALGAGIDVDAEHVREQPRPAFAAAGSIGGLGKPKLELVTRGWRGPVARRAVGRSWHDLATQSAVAREHAEVAEHVKARRWYRGDQAREQVVRLEHKRPRAVFPRGFFITNLARGTHGPKQVGELYRVRWEIEIDNKVDKSGARLDEIEARKGVSARILLLASPLNTTIARTIAQSEKLAIRKGLAPAQPAPRPPLHPIRLMRALASMNATVVRMLLQPDDPTSDWSWLMSTLRYLGHDPHWRKRLSVLDTIQGLTAPPDRKRNQRATALEDKAS